MARPDLLNGQNMMLSWPFGARSQGAKTKTGEAQWKKPVEYAIGWYTRLLERVILLVLPHEVLPAINYLFPKPPTPCPVKLL